MMPGPLLNPGISQQGNWCSSALENFTSPTGQLVHTELPLAEKVPAGQDEYICPQNIHRPVSTVPAAPERVPTEPYKPLMYGKLLGQD
jgi:hypothetical protein